VIIVAKIWIPGLFCPSVTSKLVLELVFGIETMAVDIQSSSYAGRVAEELVELESCAYLYMSSILETRRRPQSIPDT
jgi:hypothetical protein